jgi:hypothetical protein
LTGHADEDKTGKMFISAAYDDIKHNVLLREAVRRMLEIWLPGAEIRNSWRFESHFTGSMTWGQPEVVADTNINFKELSRAHAAYHQRVPATRSLSVGSFLGKVLSAREAAYLASLYLAEIMVDPISSSLINMKFTELMRKRDAQYREIDLFQSISLPNCKRVREVINSGEKTFDEFLHILDHSDKFKKFITEQNPDKKLVALPIGV